MIKDETREAETTFSYIDFVPKARAWVKFGHTRAGLLATPNSDLELLLSNEGRSQCQSP